MNFLLHFPSKSPCKSLITPQICRGNVPTVSRFYYFLRKNEGVSTIQPLFYGGNTPPKHWCIAALRCAVSVPTAARTPGSGSTAVPPAPVELVPWGSFPLKNATPLQLQVLLQGKMCHMDAKVLGIAPVPINFSNKQPYHSGKYKTNQ